MKIGPNAHTVEPELPIAARPRLSACTTSAPPSAPPVPVIAKVKDAFQLTCVERSTGDQSAEHWDEPPLVSTTEVGVVVAHGVVAEQEPDGNSTFVFQLMPPARQPIIDPAGIQRVKSYIGAR